MTAKKLREWILSLTDDIVFMYNGKIGSICPFNVRNVCIAYDGKEKEFKTEEGSCIDDVMNEKFFDGKSLSEIAEQLKF